LKSGDALDLKLYDPAMRQLIDNYVRAEDSETLLNMEDISFLDMIATDGEEAIDKLPSYIKKNEKSVSEILVANMRKMIINERPSNPAYFDKISELLHQLLQEQKDGKLQYKELIERLITKIKEAKGTRKASYPTTIDTKGKQALYDNLNKDEVLTVQLHHTIKENAKHGFRDPSVPAKMKQLRNAVRKLLTDLSEEDFNKIMEIIKAQKEY
jgi:type I restriction enzyme R subunit